MPPATANRLARDIPPLRAPYAPPDEGIARDLLADAERSSDAEARIDARARRLVAAIRARAGGLGGIEDFLHAYSLTTKEGLALMVLAEALLRVPDAETADRLIEDKLKAGDWAHQEARSTSLLGFSLRLDVGCHGSRYSSGRDAGRHCRDAGQAARIAGSTSGHTASRAAARIAFCARTDD